MYNNSLDDVRDTKGRIKIAKMSYFNFVFKLYNFVSNKNIFYDKTNFKFGL